MQTEKRGVGRPRKNRQPRTITMSDADYAIAKELGKNNASNGISLALAIAKKMVVKNAD